LFFLRATSRPSRLRGKVFSLRPCRAGRLRSEVYLGLPRRDVAFREFARRICGQHKTTKQFSGALTMTRFSISRGATVSMSAPQNRQKFGGRAERRAARRRKMGNGPESDDGKARIHRPLRLRSRKTLRRKRESNHGFHG
jgi:hypothetical protein